MPVITPLFMISHNTRRRTLYNNNYNTTQKQLLLLLLLQHCCIFLRINKLFPTLRPHSAHTDPPSPPVLHHYCTSRTDLYNNNKMMEGVRWAFNFGSWRPTKTEWLLSSQSIQLEEKDRIGKFVFAKDAKAAMAGRLLLRKTATESLGLEYKNISLARTDRGKPFLTNSLDQDKIGFNMNASHQGSFAVVAAERSYRIGVDVMKIEKPGGKDIPDFFRTMKRQFTESEWDFIGEPLTHWEQLERFYRLWCLKESYIKAIGIGLGMDLQKLQFSIESEFITSDIPCTDTELYIDGCLAADWRFEEVMLDKLHYTAVALGPPENCNGSVNEWPDHQIKFKKLSFQQLTSSCQPLSTEDMNYWETFSQKPDRYIPKK